MNVWVWAAVGLWLVTILIAVIAYRSRATGKAPLNILVIGTGAAILLTHLPLALEATRAGTLGSLHATVISLYYTAQVFFSGADVGALLDAFRSAADGVTQAQALAIGIMHASAPLLLITVIVAFFQAPTAAIRYFLRFGRDVNAFSELNEQSIALAESIKEREAKSVIVFAGVNLADAKPSPELIERARKLGAVFFKKDLLSSPLTLRSSRARIRIFTLSEDEAANAWHAVEILGKEQLSKRDNTDLYVFATTIEGDLALMSRKAGLRIRVRRINPARTLVYDWLWRDPEPGRAAGVDLFTHAQTDGAHPTISAAVVGLGAHGMEVLRALTWYCRMVLPDGRRTRLRVHAFDQDPNIATRMRSAYPGLLAEREHASLQSETTITVHGGVDATTSTLLETLRDGEPLTFVFISLGDDARNISVAVELFRECVRVGRSPQILTLSKNSAKLKVALTSLMSEAALRAPGVELPRIQLVGDLRDVFSYDAVIQSDMELNGVVCHLAWADLENLELDDAIEAFWASEYNYASSVAVPIHWKARRAVGTPGASRIHTDRTTDEHDLLRRLEHDRWCSFMLSEGFVHGDHKAAYLIRTHTLLKPFDELSDPEAAKDDNDSRDTLEKLEGKDAWTKAGESGPLRDFVVAARAAVDEAAVN